jgi:hypothetical protein
MGNQADITAGAQIFQQSWPQIRDAKAEGKREYVVYRLVGDEYSPNFWKPVVDIDNITSLKVLELYNLLVEAGETPAFMITNEDGRLECDLVVVFEK